MIVDFGGALATIVGVASALNGPGERIELWNPSLRFAVLPDGILAREDGEISAEADLDPLPTNRSRVVFMSEFAREVNNSGQPDICARDDLRCRRSSPPHTCRPRKIEASVSPTSARGRLAMSTATVERLPDGSLRVTCKSRSPAAVFVDSSPDLGGVGARGYPPSPDAAHRPPGVRGNGRARGRRGGRRAGRRRGEMGRALARLVDDCCRRASDRGRRRPWSKRPAPDRMSSARSARSTRSERSCLRPRSARAWSRSRAIPTSVCVTGP